MCLNTLAPGVYDTRTRHILYSAFRMDDANLDGGAMLRSLRLLSSTHKALPFSGGLQTCMSWTWLIRLRGIYRGLE